MPKTKTKRPARKAGINIPAKRKVRKEQGCKGDGGPTTATPSIIANSVFALTLAPKTGYDIAVLNGNSLGKIAHDLLKIYFNLTGKPIDISKVHTDKKVIEKVSKAIQSYFPTCDEYYYGRVQEDDDDIYLQIVQVCEYDCGCLPAFAVGEALSKLQKEYPRLHDIFCDFISSFTKLTGVPTWYSDGMFNEAFNRLEEIVEHEAAEIDPDKVADIKAEIDFYHGGIAGDYSRRLHNARYITPEKILSDLSRLRKKNPIINVIKNGCELMLPKYCMSDFTNDEWAEQNVGDYHLSFDRQAMIFFRWGDHSATEFDEFVNSEANEGGIADPVIVERITASSKPFNQAEFLQAKEWPNRLGQFIFDSQQIIERYIKPKKNERLAKEPVRKVVPIHVDCTV